MWMEGKPWTAVELHEIELALVERMTMYQIARCLMRNPNEVSMKVREVEMARTILPAPQPKRERRASP
jgi:hypothetical protein